MRYAKRFLFLFVVALFIATGFSFSDRTEHPWMNKVANAQNLVKSANGLFYEIVKYAEFLDSQGNVKEIMIGTHVFREINDPSLGVIPDGRIVYYSITDPQEISLVLSNPIALKSKAEEFAAFSIEKTQVFLAAEDAKKALSGSSKGGDAFLDSLIDYKKVEEHLNKK